MEVQEIILQGIFASNNLSTTTQQETYLQSLKPTVKAFRSAFNPGQAKNVSAQYSTNKEQDAYLILYFANYIKSIDYILSSLKEKKLLLSNYKQLNVDFYGAGPCPEVLGFALFGNNNSLSKNFQANTFDIKSASWTYSRNMVSSNLIPKVWGHPFNMTSNVIDLGTLNWQSANQVNKDAQFFVFQNCLNELPHSQMKNFIQSIQSLIKLMPKNAFIIFSDIIGYNEPIKAITEIENFVTADKSAIIIRSINAGEVGITSAFRNVPTIIKTNLLVDEDGLRPKTSNYRFNYSVIQKK